MPTNNTVYVDSPVSDEVRRHRLYDGQLFIFTPTAQTRALQEFAVSMIEEAFAPHEPMTAQFDLPVERWVEIFGPLKPRFIHHPETRRLLREVLVDARLRPGRPAPRRPAAARRHQRQLPDGGRGVRAPDAPRHLVERTAGAAELVDAAVPLRVRQLDGLPPAVLGHGRREPLRGVQLLRVERRRTRGGGQAHHAGHPQAAAPAGGPAPRPADPLRRAARRARRLLAAHSCTRRSPTPPAAAASASTSAPSACRDLEAGLSAPNVDSHPLGTSLRDFRRASDDAEMPAEVVAKYDSGEVPEGAVLVFSPDAERTGAP